MHNPIDSLTGLIRWATVLATRGRPRRKIRRYSTIPACVQLLERRILLTEIGWAQAGAGDFGDSASWSNQQTPTEADDVTFDKDATPVRFRDANGNALASAATRQLDIENDAEVAFELLGATYEVQVITVSGAGAVLGVGGGAVNVQSNIMVADGQGESGELAISGEDAHTTISSGALEVGNGANSDGTVQFTNGASGHVTRISLGSGMESSGELTVGSGAAVHSSGAIDVGLVGRGFLNLSDGSLSATVMQFGSDNQPGIEELPLTVGALVEIRDHSIVDVDDVLPQLKMESKAGWVSVT